MLDEEKERHRKEQEGEDELGEEFTAIKLKLQQIQFVVLEIMSAYYKLINKISKDEMQYQEIEKEN